MNFANGLIIMLDFIKSCYSVLSSTGHFFKEVIQPLLISFILIEFVLTKAFRNYIHLHETELFTSSDSFLTSN